MFTKIFSRVKQVVSWAMISCMLLMLILTLHYPKQPKPPIFEYKVVSFFTDGNQRTGSSAARFSTVNISSNELTMSGIDGWELVGTALEMETAFPNFGNSSYVTGIQSNIRPQRLICIFKRRIN